MEILRCTDDAVEVRLAGAEARSLYNLLVEAESWPIQAVGPRPFIRQIREELSAALAALEAD